MPDVQQIEASVGENDGVAVLAPLRRLPAQLFAAIYFAVLADSVRLLGESFEQLCA